MLQHAIDVSPGETPRLDQIGNISAIKLRPDLFISMFEGWGPLDIVISAPELGIDFQAHIFGEDSAIGLGKVARSHVKDDCGGDLLNDVIALIG